MAVDDIRGVPTLDGMQHHRSIWKGTVTTTGLSYFRIGEGGFQTVGATQTPKDPDDSGQGYSTLSDVEAPIDIDVDPSNPGLRFKQKSFVPADFTDVGVSTLRIRCLLTLAEGNYNPRKPKYFEVGVFDNNNVMIAYGTFPEVEKDNTVELERYMEITF